MPNLNFKISRKQHKKYKGEIYKTTRTIPEHLMFYGLPKNDEGRYTRLKYIKPLTQYITANPPDNYGLNEALMKMCIPAPETTFENELEKTITEMEEMFSKKLMELDNLMQEAGISDPSSLNE